MDAVTQTRTFRQGAGRISLDFIRTLRRRGTEQAVEELAEAADLQAWIAQLGPFDADVAVTAPEPAAEARQLREAVFELISAARAPGGPTQCRPSARAQINRVALLPVPAPRMDAAATIHWEAVDPVSATLSLIARDALDLVVSPAIASVRGCANPDCGALFLDSSRPGTRRWCSMDTCGNQAKKGTWRAKATGN
jgi:predicted RNA-binding Zn ribbon-like protein